MISCFQCQIAPLRHGNAGHVRPRRGGAVQVDPGFEAIDPTLAFRDFQLLKPKQLPSKVALKCNLRHYNEDRAQCLAAGAGAADEGADLIGQGLTLLHISAQPEPSFSSCFAETTELILRKELMVSRKVD